MTLGKVSSARFSMVCLAAFFSIALAAGVSAQEHRYALVIGNGAYEHVTKLTNPTNDAKDMADSLKAIGFTVDLLQDRDLVTMEDAVVRLGNRLSTSADTVGFFYYAGHGVQSAGTNYLIPTEASIPSASFLPQKALALQSVLDTLQASGNKLNVVVLDACRDNPFSWSRSSSRGLTVIGAQPTGSIIVYATSAGTVAQDGQGRNGVFTGELLKHLRSPGTDIADVFKQTGAAVSAATAGSQVPAVYTQFFGSYAFVPGASPVQPAVAPVATVTQSTGSILITTATDGALYLDGKAMADISAGADAKIDSVAAGSRSIEIRYVDGQVERRITVVEAGSAAVLHFIYRSDIFKLAKAGTAQSVRAVVAKGANVNAQDSSQTSPLGYAARYTQSTEVITALLEAGANVNGLNWVNVTALMFAAMYNPNPEVLTTLLNAGAEVNAQGMGQMTPLGYAASNNPNPEILTRLLHAGAEINAKTVYGGTPLMLAAMYNQNPDVITTLLEAGADAKARGADGKTALDYASRNPKLKDTDAYRQLQKAAR